MIFPRRLEQSPCSQMNALFLAWLFQWIFFIWFLIYLVLSLCGADNFISPGHSGLPTALDKVKKKVKLWMWHRDRLCTFVKLVIQGVLNSSFQKKRKEEVINLLVCGSVI